MTEDHVPITGKENNYEFCLCFKCIRLVAEYMKIAADKIYEQDVANGKSDETMPGV